MAYPYNTYMPYTQYNAYSPAQGAFNAPVAPQPMPASNTMPQPAPASGGFVCRPVTSKEEALAIQVDCLSAGTVMPDLGHGTMYLKRFDPNTGLSNIFEFALVQPSESQPEQKPAVMPDYSDAFRSFGEQLGSVSDRLDELALKLDQLRAKQPVAKGGIKE